MNCKHYDFCRHYQIFSETLRTIISKFVPDRKITKAMVKSSVMGKEMRIAKSMRRSQDYDSGGRGYSKDALNCNVKVVCHHCHKKWALEFELS